MQNPGPQRPKRVLVVSQHFWPEDFRINDIVEGFMADGIEVDVLCGLPNYPMGEWFDGYKYTGPRRQNYKGAQVFRSGEIRRKGNTNLRIFFNFVSFPFFALFSLPRLRGRKYDAVFCYETAPVFMMLPAIVYAKSHKTPLTTYVLDLWPDNLYAFLPIKNKLLRFLLQKASNWHYKRSTRLIGMSDALGKRLETMYHTGKRPAEIAVIPQYCEDFYAEKTTDVELESRYAGKFNILFAGNISPLQDLENLVNAMKLVVDSGEADIRCLLVGDGMSRDDLRLYIEKQGLEHYFEFCGRVPPSEIPRWTGIADALFAGLAKSANLSLTVPAKITSYFAAGKPMLVATDEEAARVSEESGAALVSPPGDVEALADNILQLYRMPQSTRDAMGASGFAYYQKNFKREALLQQLKDFILKPL